MPGETSKKIGELGEDLCSELLDKLGWEFVRDSFDFEYETSKLQTPGGEPKKHHGIDGVYKYYDFYEKKLVYVILSAKALTWQNQNKLKTNGVLAKQLRAWIDELNSKVSFARRSKDFKSKVSLGEGTTAKFVGMLVYYVHTGPFSDNKYAEVLKKISIPRQDQFEETVYVVSNREIGAIQSVLSYLQHKATGGDELKFVWPNLDTSNPEFSLSEHLSLEQIFSSFIISSVGEKTVVSYLKDTDGNSVEFLLSALGHFQVFREEKLEIGIYKAQSINDPEIKMKIEGRQICSDGESATTATVQKIPKQLPEFNVR